MKFKHYTLIHIICMILIFGCSEESDIPTPEPEPEINIEFSESPIDLGGIDAQFAENIPYDIYDETVFDIFLPSSTQATGMVIYIHGGGFTAGDKGFIYNASSAEEVKTFLSNDIAVATINYRLLQQTGETEGVLKPLHDSRRALQYIRSVSIALNIDKERIILAGGSAGAGTSLWIATNDDMKDESNSDAVLHESTRVKAIALRQTQSSYDIEDRWIDDVFIDYDTSFDDILDIFQEKVFVFYGVSSLEEYNTPEIEAYRDQVDMLSLITSDDPEIWAESISTTVGPPVNEGIGNHHAFHVREIKEKADAAGVPNVCYYGKNPILFSDPSNENFIDFVIRKLNE